MQEPDATAEQQSALAAEPPIKDWHKPVLTIMPANNAENLPGGFPDSGIDFS